MKAWSAPVIESLELDQTQSGGHVSPIHDGEWITVHGQRFEGTWPASGEPVGPDVD